MSSVIDERVVQMSFDNDQFEKGVSQTIKSLNKLDKTLVDTADGEYFTNMEERISKVEQAFSKSGMVINGILLTIGQTITQYINKGLSVLTQGIRGGMAEYETQMGATQTILANVKDEGKGIDDVTAALDQLNAYADKTIYNFTEMTRNIGMFTAAGANLDTSVATIKGLANAAALVGANATTAARAWYQVSQAMAAGSFKLMDWRSLEISNIAGEGFKSVLTEVARKDGLAVAKMIDNGTALRDTLKSGWLTAERFAEAMSILTNELSEDQLKTLGYTEEQAKMLKEIATEAEYAAVKVKSFTQLIETTNEAIGSGWAVTFRTIIGDFETARDFYTRISITLGNVIDKISDYRNYLLDLIWNWAPSGGASPYDNFKRTLDNLLAIFSTFIGAVRAGFDNIFKWDEINKNLNKFAEGLKKTSKAFVINKYADITNYYKNAEEEIKDIEHKYEELDDFKKSNIWDLDYVTEGIKDLIRVFRGAFAAVDIVLRTVGDTFNWLIGQIPGIDNFYENLENGNLGVLSMLANVADKVTMIRDMIVDLNLIPNILNLIKQSIINIVKTNPLLMGMVNGLIYAEKMIKALLLVLKEININPFNVLLGALKLIGGAIYAVIYGISEAITKIVQFVSGNVNFSFLDSIGEGIITFIVLLNELGKGTITVADVFDYYKKKVIAAFEAILHNPFIEGVVKFFTNAWKQIKLFWNNFISFFTNIGDNISGFYEKYFGDYQFNIKDLGIFGVLTTIAVLLYKFARDVEGWASIGARIADVLNAFANKINSEALLNVAKAIGILAASVFLLSLIPYQTLLDTVSLLLLIMGMLIALFSVIKGVFDAKNALEKATKPFEEAVTALAKGISSFIKKIGNAILLEAIGDALIKITLAIVGLALAFEFMPNSIGKALITITVITAALLGLAIAFNILTKSVIDIKRFTDRSPMKVLKNIAEAGMQFLKLAGLALILEGLSNAIIKIAAAIAILSLLDPSGLWRGLGAVLLVVVSLMAVLVAIEAASEHAKPSALLAFSLTIISFGAVVASLATVAALIGLLPLDVILKGFIAIGGLIVVLGGILSIIAYNTGVYTSGVFLSLAAMMGALGISIAAIVGVSSLIQNETQLEAMREALIGYGVLFAAILTFIAIFGKFNPDVGIMLSLSVVIGVFALTIVAIAGSLKALDGVKVNPTILKTLETMTWALIALVGVIGVLSVVVGALGEIGWVALAAIFGLALVIAAYGFVIQSIGKAVLDIAEAQLKFQDSLKGWYEIFQYINKNSKEFMDTLKGAAETILQSIPDLFALFLSVGIAIGTAMMAITIGIRALIGGVVLNACTMLLEVIILISDWINSNSGLILTAFSKLWAAVLNLAIIALKLALQDILPSVLSVIFNFFSLPLVLRVLGLLLNLWSLIFVGLGDAFKSSGIPVLELIGEFFTVIGEAAGWAADKVGEVVDWINEKFNWIVEKLKALGIELEGVEASVNSLTNASFEMADGVNDTMLKTADAFWGSVDSMTSGINKLSDVNTKAVEQQEQNSRKYSEIKKEEAKSFGESTDLEVSSLEEGAKAMFNISDANMEDITGIFGDGFNLNLDNQSSYIEAYLSGVDYMGEQDNNKTAGYLIKNSELYETYWKENAGLAEEYYTAMATYNSMMATATDNTARQEAMTYKKKYVDPALEALTGSKLSLEKVLNDGIDYEVKPLTKQKQEAYIQSWTELGDMMSDYMANYQAPEVDTDMYSPSFGTSGTDTSKLESELKDRNDTIGKYDSEIQPKDLTPTIDLDSLKNEVNQANGIMTGSLLAAQNAAIGDYINTDSELNPFLKDRWQNTYNFTQNNYSPKALSRIDIYRQTQNQLRLSRGF